MAESPVVSDSTYPYYGHDAGVVVTQPRSGEFERRPMTTGELAARDPALKIAKDIYRHANQAGVCYFEFWRLIADAIERAAKPEPRIRLLVRPMLVSGQLATDPKGLLILVDSEQPEHEQVASLWHETLHALGLTDEVQVEAIARDLAEACPTILRALAPIINLSRTDSPP